MDLLQDLDLSKKSSSPFSEPSKSNLHHRQTGGQTDGGTGRQTGRQTSKIRGMGAARSARQLGREPGVLSQKLSSNCIIKLSCTTQHPSRSTRHSYAAGQRNNRNFTPPQMRTGIPVSPAPWDTRQLSCWICGPAQFL